MREFIKNFIRFSVISLIIWVYQTSFAANSLPTIIPDYDYADFDKVISQLYQSAPASHSTRLSDRIHADSAFFLNTKYLLGALGEGKSAPYDQGPLYRTDAFDCTTFVSSVIALANASNTEQFKRNLLAINYQNDNPTFVERNHFMETDWNIHNAEKGFIRDITDSIRDANDRSVAQTATVLINKPAWFRHLPMSSLKLLQPLPIQEAQHRLQQLHAEGDKVSAETGSIPFIPMTALYDTAGNPNLKLFQQIPDSAIIEIVFPKPNSREKIGTPLDVAHMGIAIRTPKGLLFREASSLHHRVVDVDLIAYLQKQLPREPQNGINLQAILLK